MCSQRFSFPLVHVALIIMGVNVFACQSIRHIEEDGLKHVKIGMAMPGPGAKQVKKYPLRDTTLTEGGYEWYAQIYNYGEGEVWVESDFFGEDRVNRIRVQAADLFVKGSGKLRVGSRVEELKAIHQRWQVSYLADYGFYDLIDPGQSRIHYLVNAPDSPDPDPQLADLDAGAQVVAIVIM